MKLSKEAVQTILSSATNRCSGSGIGRQVFPFGEDYVIKVPYLTDWRPQVDDWQNRCELKNWQLFAEEDKKYFVPVVAHFILQYKGQPYTALVAEKVTPINDMEELEWGYGDESNSCRCSYTCFCSAGYHASDLSDPDIIKYWIDGYGLETDAEEMYATLRKYRINDIHSGNFGVTNDNRLVMLDYGYGAADGSVCEDYRM